MTVRDREVLDLLRDEPELLAIADAVQAAHVETAPAPRAAWRPRLAMVAVAVAAVAALALAAPWERSDNGRILDRALAAVGDGPVVHAIVRFSDGVRVEIATGRRVPRVTEIESWADEAEGSMRLVERRDGRVVARLAGSSDAFLLETIFIPSRLAALYRRALEGGDVRVVRDGTLRGRRVFWLESEEVRGRRWEVAVDAESYAPLLQRLYAHGRLELQLDVVRMETLPRNKTPLVRSLQGWRTVDADPRQSWGSEGGPVGAYTLAQARYALPRPSLWAGRKIAGHELWSVRLVTTEERTGASTGQTRASAEMVRLEYGRTRWQGIVRAVVIDQGPAEDVAALWRLRGVTAPPRGFVDLTTSRMGMDERVRWHGRLRRGGLYIAIDAWSERDVVAAARALRPIPRDTAEIDAVLAARCDSPEEFTSC